MAQKNWYAVTLAQASKDFGVSKRTIERKIADGTISQTQIFTQEGKRNIYIAELIRAFGEGKARIENEDPKTEETEAPQKTALVEELRKRAERAEKLADEERERAQRYESERDELRKKCDELVTRLLPPPAPEKPKGWLRRVFGGSA